MTLEQWRGGTAAIYDGVHIVGSKRVVEQLSDLPAAVSGVITLAANTSYEIVGDLDLLGARLALAGATTIYGQSSETSALTSTGLSGDPIIYAPYSLSMRHIEIVVPSGAEGVELDNPFGAYDWFGVNVTGDGLGLRITDADNVVLLSTVWECAAGGVLLTGDLNSLVAELSVLNALSGSYGVKFDGGSLIARRLRWERAPVIVAGTATGFDTPLATIAASEAHILGTLNFSGAGTYIDGITYLDDEARWDGNRGISNSTRLGQLYWTGNATQTAIATAGTYVKAAGTTIAGAYNQRFDHPAANRLEYASALTQTFRVEARASITAGNNHQIGLRVYKNGAAIDAVVSVSTTSANNKAEGLHVWTYVDLADGDYIEAWVTNLSTSGNITVTELALSAEVR